jgi:hypothetical protein
MGEPGQYNGIRVEGAPVYIRIFVYPEAFEILAMGKCTAECDECFYVIDREFAEVFPGMWNSEEGIERSTRPSDCA